MWKDPTLHKAISSLVFRKTRQESGDGGDGRSLRRNGCHEPAPEEGGVSRCDGGAGTLLPEARKQRGREASN